MCLGEVAILVSAEGYINNYGDHFVLLIRHHGKNFVIGNTQIRLLARHLEDLKHVG